MPSSCKLDSLNLAALQPYVGAYTQMTLLSGDLDAELDARYDPSSHGISGKVDSSRLRTVDNALREDFIKWERLALGARVDSADAVSLPLRIAVALLKDRNGVIDLGLPVTGSLDDPKFRLGPIIWKAFVNLLAGVATSPFKLLGSVFGGGEEVNLIDFEAGSAELGAEAVTRLAALSRALHERPQLSLEVPATYSPDADAGVLAARRLQARLSSLGGGPESDAARRFGLLLAIHRVDKPDATLPPGALALQSVRVRDREAAALEEASRELERALLPGIAALGPELESLAQQRARNIQDALLASGEVEPACVFLIAPGPGPAVGGRPRAALSLK